MTRILKSYGDELLDRGPVKGSEEASGARSRRRQQILRSLAMLIRLSGSYVPRFLPQFMVLLGSCVRAETPEVIKLQSLEGWHTLVLVLAKNEAAALAAIINQVHLGAQTPCEFHRTCFAMLILVLHSDLEKQAYCAIVILPA